MQRGRLAVIFMLVMGLSLALFAWQWNRLRVARGGQIWGSPESALLIRAAPQVNAYRLLPQPHDSDAPPPEGANILRAGDEWWEVLETKDVSQASGLLHARNSLLEDASFNFENPAGADPLYTYAAKFSDAKREVIVFFDPETQHVRSSLRPTMTQLVPHVSEGWRKAFERYFAGRREQDGESKAE